MRSRLRGGAFVVLGADCGVATVGDAVRFPDALVTATPPADGNARLIEGAVVVFEILSPSTSRTDRVVKAQEYGAVPTIRRYAMIESTSVGVTVLSRDAGTGPWRTTTRQAGEVLDLPELAIGLPMDELYVGLTFSPA